MSEIRQQQRKIGFIHLAPKSCANCNYGYYLGGEYNCREFSVIVNFITRNPLNWICNYWLRKVKDDN